MSQNKNSPTYRVGILGATGIVGQRFVSMLEHHPWFRVVRLAASEHWKGVTYAQTKRWKLSMPIPKNVRNMPMVPCKTSHFVGECDLVFSGLDAAVAGKIESEFAEAGIPVFSNAKSHRYNPFVPILLPYVNPEHLSIVKEQPSFQHSGGFIVTNANCSSTGLCVGLAPLIKAFPDLNQLFVTTLQAISGAGYPGLPSMDIVNNVVPFIDGEEEKLEDEPRHILGKIKVDMNEKQHLHLASLKISAACHRVPVVDGHTLTCSTFIRKVGGVESRAKEISIIVGKYLSQTRCTRDEAITVVESAFKSFSPPEEVRLLPSCPINPIVFCPEIDRPQPRHDHLAGEGMSVVVGRVRQCPINTVKFSLVVHNTVLGAAGGSILNAELAASRGLIPLSQRQRVSCSAQPDA